MIPGPAGASGGKVTNFSRKVINNILKTLSNQNMYSIIKKDDNAFLREREMPLVFCA